MATVAVPDLVSNSYFPAIAAIELGFFREEGLDASHELIFPNYKAYEALRDGRVDFVAAPAHVALRAFPQWQGCKLLAALAQGMYWLLVLRADLAATPGDVNAVKGRLIGAAPMVELGLKQLLIDAGIDLARDGVRIVGVPGTHEPGVSFGVAAAKALEEGRIEGFWANAMGADNAVRRGVGKVVLDVRRGLGPRVAFHYTMPVLATSDRAIERDPDLVAAGVRAVVKVQRALKADVTLAAQVGRAPVSAGRGRRDRRRGRARSAVLPAGDHARSRCRHQPVCREHRPAGRPGCVRSRSSPRSLRVCGLIDPLLRSNSMSPPNKLRSAFVPHDLSAPIAGAAKGPLAGLTVAVKDMYDIAGSHTGGGSPVWLDKHAPAKRHAAPVRKFLAAGATVIGKTICDEFFFSLTGANAHYGTPLNPRAPGTHAGRLLGRLGGGHRSGRLRLRARQRYRRIGTRARVVLRDLRHPRDARARRYDRRDGHGTVLRCRGLVRERARRLPPRRQGAAGRSANIRADPQAHRAR